MTPASATDTIAAATDSAQLPEQRVTTAEGPMDVQRAWPVPGAEAPTLALELHDGEALRGGWWSAGQLRLLPHGSDPKLSDLAGAADRGVVVSHRPGKRAVLRSHSGQHYVKVVKGGRASGILDGIARAADFSGPFRTPEVVESTTSTVTFAALEGQSMHEAQRFTAEQWETAWTQIFDAWLQAVSQPQQAAAGAPARQTDPINRSGLVHRGGLIHRAAAEAAVLRHWHQSTLPWLKDAGEAGRSVNHVAELLESLPEEQLRPAHRDLHDKQLLWSAGSGPGLLDVDTACLADPALDLGNLRAHALLRRIQGLWSAAAAETVTFCLDEAAHHIGAPMPTVAVYEQSALLRLGFVYAVRPKYAQVGAALRELVRD